MLNHASEILFCSLCRLFPIVETSLFRNGMQPMDNVIVTSSSDRTIRLWWKVLAISLVFIINVLYENQILFGTLLSPDILGIYTRCV